ncbi:MAG: glycosyltransferase family 4 protein [Beijerinckiaceae bacterium]|nr:glycosyltransferase family 4 protein [Beijerinckiaceae bacterium]
MRDASTGPIWLLVDGRGMGGIERHVCVLCSALVARGLPAQVVLLTDHGRTHFTDALESGGIPHRILDGSARSVFNAMRAQRPALVHTHGYKAGVVGRLSARLAGVPCVSTFHAGERAPFPVGLYQRLDEMLAFLSRPISVSADIAARLPWSSTMIPNFIPTPAEPCAGPLPKRVAFVGRLSEEKGPDIFCQIARANAARAEFHVYGDGPMRNRLEEQYGDCVRFHGHVADIGRVWRDSGLLLITSRAEGLPMACLEAMAHGVPVAAARVGALPVLIEPGRNGWLFNVADVDGASDALASWASLAPADHQQLRDACKARIAESYGLDRGLNATLRVYDAAMGEPLTASIPLPGGA